MDEIKLRVETELQELTTKIVGLIKFKYSDKFYELSEEMRNNMEAQLYHMMEYAKYLSMRLNIWGKTDAELREERHNKLAL